MYVTLINVCGVVVFLTADIFATVLDDEINLKNDHDLIEDLLQKKDSRNFRFSKFLDIRFDVDDNKPFNVEELIRSKMVNDSEVLSKRETFIENSIQQDRVEADHDSSQRLLKRIDDLTNKILNLSTVLNETKHEMKELKKNHSIIVNRMDRERQEVGYELMEFRENVSIVLADLNDQMGEMRKNVSSILSEFNHEGVVLTEMVNEMEELRKNVLILRENQTSLQNDIKKLHYSEQNRSEHNTSLNIPQDCKEILNRGTRVSGIYQIQPNSSPKPFFVLCDMNINGGGWTHIQNRFDGSQDFFLGWNDYKAGFGKIDGEFWLGLDNINFLTSVDSDLLIKLVDENQNVAFAHYKYFSVGDELNGYRLSNPTFIDGSAGDSLSIHADQKFSTKDKDQDSSSKHCAEYYGGAWWYNNCLKSDLNAKLVNYNSKTDRVYWDTALSESMKFPIKTKMLVRRV